MEVDILEKSIKNKKEESIFLKPNGFMNTKLCRRPATLDWAVVKCSLRKALAFILMLSVLLGSLPLPGHIAYAAQQNSYHDPAEHWMSAVNRTNELDANAVVTQETFTCYNCGKATQFTVWRTPEYTRSGDSNLSHNVKYSDGTMVDGVTMGSIDEGKPGVNAYYTFNH